MSYIVHTTPYGRLNKEGQLVPRNHPESYIPVDQYDKKKLEKQTFILNPRAAFQTFLGQVIKCMSSLHYQKRVWVRKKGPELDSFQELMKDFFSFLSTLEVIEHTYPEYGMSEKTFRFFALLCKYIHEFYPKAPQDPKALLKDPRWKTITRQARLLLLSAYKK